MISSTNPSRPIRARVCAQPAAAAGRPACPRSTVPPVPASLPSLPWPALYSKRPGMHPRAQARPTPARRVQSRCSRTLRFGSSRTGPAAGSARTRTDSGPDENVSRGAISDAGRINGRRRGPPMLLRRPAMNNWSRHCSGRVRGWAVPADPVSAGYSQHRAHKRVERGATHSGAARSGAAGLQFGRDLRGHAGRRWRRPATRGPRRLRIGTCRPRRSCRSTAPICH